MASARICGLRLTESQLRWVGEVGVHLSPSPPAGASVGELRTHTVRFSPNFRARLRIGEKCTPADPTPSMPKFVNRYSRENAAMISRSNSVTCSCISARAAVASRPRIASSSMVWSKTAEPRPGTRSSTTYQTRSESTK